MLGAGYHWFLWMLQREAMVGVCSSTARTEAGWDQHTVANGPHCASRFSGTATRKPEPEQEKQSDHTVKIAGSIAGILLFIIIFLGVILLMKKR